MSAKAKIDTPKTPMEVLLGPNLATNAKGGRTPTASAFKDKDLVALYFSASWCPPCKAFSPVLKEFYNAISKKNNFEIVYISSDKNIKEWEDYYGTMPWLSLPEGANEKSSEIKNKLASMMKIQGIPTMIVLEVNTGKFVTASGREDVMKVAGRPEQMDAVIQNWKSLETVPVEEAMLTAPDNRNPLVKFVFFLFKNPILIFALVYFYKQYLKHTAGGHNDAAGSSTIEDEDGDNTATEQHDGSEF